MFEKEIFSEEEIRMNKLRVWIHCRVTNESERFLLEYQKEKIMKVIPDTNVKIVGITQEVSAGRDSHSRALDAIRIHACRKDIDIVIVSDKTRLLVSEDRYQEFKLICKMYDVQILDLHESEVQFKNFLFNI